MHRESKSPPIDLVFNGGENMQAQANEAIKITTTERGGSVNSNRQTGFEFGGSPLNKLSIVPPFELQNQKVSKRIMKSPLFQ